MDIAEEPASPLLLVPGVCGTILSSRRKGAKGEGDICWVTLSSPDVRYQKLWGRYDASSGVVKGFDDKEEILIPDNGDDSGLYAITILNPDAGYGMPVIHYFDSFVNYLTGSQGYTVGKDLWGFGYDFRQSNTAHAQDLLRRLRDIRAATGKRVHVVSHSMGCLAVRSLLINHPKEFEELVEAWVAAGAPFGGAPGFGTDALVTGVQFAGSIGAYFFVDRGTFRQACVQSPAVYELLPPAGFQFRGAAPEIALWLSTPLPDGALARAAPALARRWAVPPGTHPSAHYGELTAAEGGCRALQEGENGGLGWHEVHEYHFGLDALPSLLEGVLDGNAVTVEGKQVAMPFNAAAFEKAQQSQALWSRVSLPKSCRFYNLYGTGYSTPYSLQYGSWWFPVADLPSLAHANASFVTVDGDGTVPVECATADGFDAVERVGIRGDHRGLIAMQAGWDQVLTWLRSGTVLDAGERWNLVVSPDAAKTA